MWNTLSNNWLSEHEQITSLCLLWSTSNFFRDKGCAMMKGFDFVRVWIRIWVAVRLTSTVPRYKMNIYIHNKYLLFPEISMSGCLSKEYIGMVDNESSIPIQGWLAFHFYKKMVLVDIGGILSLLWIKNVEKQMPISLQSFFAIYSPPFLYLYF